MTEVGSAVDETLRKAMGGKSVSSNETKTVENKVSIASNNTSANTTQPVLP